MIPVLRCGWESELVDLLDRHRGLYLELRLLGREQQMIVASTDPDLGGLVRLSRRRRNVIDQLVRLAQRLEIYRRAWPESWPRLDPGVRSHLAALLEAVREMLEALLQEAPPQENERCN